MHFGLSDEQSELAQTVHTVLERRSNSAAVRAAANSERGYDTGLWRVLSEEIGAPSLAIPEEYGGAGFSSFELHLVLEELGYTLTPSPMLGSAVVAAEALRLAGDVDACERLLPGIADGTSIATVAWAETAGRPERRELIATDSGSWHLDGRVRLVLDGMSADVVLAVAETEDGPALFEVDSRDGLRRTATPALDTTLQFATYDFARVAAHPLLLDARSVVDKLRDRALIAVTALQVGAARRALDMTLQYAKDRVQFGRPIGSFQVIKHALADMLVDVETARTVSWAAAWAASTDAPDLAAQAAFAKAWCSEATNHAAASTIQLHGGIAITWEHDAQLIFKRGHALDQLFGQARSHRRSLFELRQLASR